MLCGATRRMKKSPPGAEPVPLLRERVPDHRVAAIVLFLFLLVLNYIPVFFFFSSRRRHTIFDCDWSSDVCSSDLLVGDPVQGEHSGVGETLGQNLKTAP